MSARPLLAAVVALALGAGAARAEDRAAAERYFHAGAQAYAAQNFAAAAADFDEAYAAMPLPEIAFSAAQAYRKLYRLESRPEDLQRAVELYRIYLAQVKTGGRVGDAADNLAELTRELDRLKLAANALAPRAEHTRLGVSVTISDQSGARETAAVREIGDATGELAKGLVATLDGKPIAPFALIDVDPKEHVFSVRADGYLPSEKKAVAVPGQSQLIEIELHPQPATVTLHTESGARIAIDGRTAATAPTSALELAAGKHFLAVTHRGRAPFGRELVLVRGQALTLNAPLVRTPRRGAVPWIAGGAGVLLAGAATTAIFAIARDGTAQDLRTRIAAGGRPPADADAYDAAVQSRDHFATATWLLGGAAVLVGAGALGLYLFDEPSAEGLHFAPVATRGGAAAVLGGRF